MTWGKRSWADAPGTWSGGSGSSSLCSSSTTTTRNSLSMPSGEDLRIRMLQYEGQKCLACRMVVRLLAQHHLANWEFANAWYKAFDQSDVRAIIAIKASVGQSNCCPNLTYNWAVVVAQLVERALPIPEVRGLNPVIGNNLCLYWTFVYCQLCIEKTKIRKKRPGMAHFKKLNLQLSHPLALPGYYT